MTDNASFIDCPDVSCTGSYASGASVILSAAAAAGYRFDGWSGSVTGASSPVTVTMKGPVTVTELFTATGGTDGGGSSGGSGGSGGTPTECTNDADCDDSLFCNGPELCSSGTCIPGERPCGTDETCDEEADACVPPAFLDFGGAGPDTAEVVVSNYGDLPLTCAVEIIYDNATAAGWLSVETWSPVLNGGDNDSFTVTAVRSGLAPGAYSAAIRVAARGADYEDDACVAVFLTMPQEAGGCPHDGDVNGDGELTSRDAVLAMLHFFGMGDLTECQVQRADINCDGTVTMQDLSGIIGCAIAERFGRPCEVCETDS